MDALLKAIQNAVGSTASDDDLGNVLSTDDKEKIYVAVTGRKWMGADHPQETTKVFSPTPPIHPPSDEKDVAAAVANRVP